MLFIPKNPMPLIGDDDERSNRGCFNSKVSLNGRLTSWTNPPLYELHVSSVSNAVFGRQPSDLSMLEICALLYLSRILFYEK